MELVQDFMPVLVVCKFEDDPIKSEGAIVSIMLKVCNLTWKMLKMAISFIGPIFTGAGITRLNRDIFCRIKVLTKLNSLIKIYLLCNSSG